jgi:flagellum-specific peptidoglycan hydrolase FlgJ
MTAWLWGALGVAILAGAKAASMMWSTPEEFVKGLRETLGGVAPHLSPAAQQLVIAHAALESGWGKSTPAKLGYNLFNVTRTKSDTRPVIESGDLECDAAGACRPITQRFAKYESVGEALADYFRLLSGTRYRAALGRLEAGDAAGFVAELRAGGYFTLPLAEYQSRFAGVLAGVRKRWS